MAGIALRAVSPTNRSENAGADSRPTNTCRADASTNHLAASWDWWESELSFAWPRVSRECRSPAFAGPQWACRGQRQASARGAVAQALDSSHFVAGADPGNHERHYLSRTGAATAYLEQVLAVLVLTNLAIWGTSTVQKRDRPSNRHVLGH